MMLGIWPGENFNLEKLIMKYFKYEAYKNAIINTHKVPFSFAKS